uniref:Uncharacterized protein n=1 Tax=Anguilla anguilla TaxID=7936 RepID=A0A0E9WY50_ANGAN
MPFQYLRAECKADLLLTPMFFLPSLSLYKKASQKYFHTHFKDLTLLHSNFTAAVFNYRV